jgi:hypothetical protein
VVTAAVPILAEAVFILRSDLDRLVATMSDDAFYYLEIARRAAGGEGFTFDGVNATSGFHPLWQWLLTGLHRLVPGDVAFIQAARLLGLAMAAAAIVIVVRLLWRTVGSYPALGALLLASHGTALLGLLSDGMETGLVALVLAVLFWSLHRLFQEPTPRHALIVGIVTATLCLARLDMAATVPVIAIAIVWRTRSWRTFGAWAGGGMLIGVPYAIWHLARNGGVLTTSAAVKRRWTDDLVSGELGGWFSRGHLEELAVQSGAFVNQVVDDVTASPLGSAAGAVGGLAVLFLAVLGIADGWRRHRASAVALGPLGAAAMTMGAVLAAKFLLDLWTVPRWVLYWYSVPTRLAVLLALGAAAGAGLRLLFEERGRVVGGAALAVAALVLLPSGTLDTFVPPERTVGQVWQMELQRAADWIEAEGPPGRYGAFDAGLLGYRLDGRYPLVNLDGLVNDREFGEFLESRPSRLETARREGVEILVNDLRVAERESDLACALTLYEGAGSVKSDAAIAGPDRIYVLDLRPCFS